MYNEGIEVCYGPECFDAHYRGFLNNLKHSNFISIKIEAVKYPRRFALFGRCPYM